MPQHDHVPENPELLAALNEMFPAKSEAEMIQEIPPPSPAQIKRPATYEQALKMIDERAQALRNDCIRFAIRGQQKDSDICAAQQAALDWALETLGVKR